MCGVRVGTNSASSIPSDPDMIRGVFPDQALVHMVRHVVQSPSHVLIKGCPATSLLSPPRYPGFPTGLAGHTHLAPVEPRLSFPSKLPPGCSADCFAIGATSHDDYWVGAEGSSRRIRDRFMKKLPKAALRQFKDAKRCIC